MNLKTLLLHNWRSKIASLFLAFAIWYLIDSNLRPQKNSGPPVPGTVEPLPAPETIPEPPVPGLLEGVSVVPGRTATRRLAI